MTAELSPGAYAAGIAATALVAGVLAWGAWQLRDALLPDWSGAPARLAEAVLALAAGLAAAEALGSFGALRRGWTLLGEVGAGLLLVAGARVGRGRRPPIDQRSGPGPASAVGTRPAVAEQATDRPVASGERRWEVRAAVIGLAVVVAQWGGHTADALARGMTHPDTLWYHGPFTARFLQRGSFSGLAGLGYESARSYPFNSEVLHALAAMPFDRDLLSPLLNLGWLALAALAAWCLGRRRGVGSLCLLGAVVALGLPILSGTQPGQASNDASAAILLLAAAALLAEGGLAPVPVALAGMAAGLALGTKLIVVAPVAAIAAGVTVLALRDHRPRAAALWWAGLTACSGYWFVRNWVALDNPLPWFALDFGPLSFPQRIDEGGSSLASHLTDREYWRLLYLPSFRQALGRGWPVMPLVPLAGAAAALGQRRSIGLDRVFGAAVVTGLVAYVFTPLGGGLAVWSNVRYLAPILVLGFAFAPLMLTGPRAGPRRVAAAVLLLLVALNASTPRKAAMSPWPEGRVLPGVLLGLAVVAVGLLRGTPASRVRPRPVPARVSRLALAGLVATSVATGGWWVQRRYLEHRYVGAGLPLDSLNALFRDVSGARVAVVGTVETYPMFGADLSNRVVQLDRPVDAAPEAVLCHRWRPILDGRVDYVVLTSYGVVYTAVPPADWFDDPAVTELLRDGTTTVYRVDGRLRPPACV